MKAIILTALLSLGSAFAFDPAGPPPKQTLEWTVEKLKNARIPRVHFEETSIEDAVIFAGHPEVPKAYKVSVMLSDEKAVQDKRINLDAKDIRQIDLITAIAEQAGLDILIQPGRVLLVKREESSK